MLLYRQEQQARDALVEIVPGISAIRCPKPEEGEQPCNGEEPFRRELKITQRLALPEEAIAPKREVPIPT
jgi:hypothetical protein